MPVKFKESATGRDKKSTHYYMRSTPLNELTAAFLASSTVPKRKQKIKNELVARRFDFATLIQEQTGRLDESRYANTAVYKSNVLPDGHSHGELYSIWRVVYVDILEGEG